MSVACGGESPLDGICLSEADKTAVLTLIREEVMFSFVCRGPVSANLPHLNLQLPTLCSLCGFCRPALVLVFSELMALMYC